ncbi:hypothetical protein AAGU66_14115 [Edwardsiella ictaluri]|uniref:Uncharacterized protein n=2 Tax=Edwardsiella ictaluri TaxID=67780 RepID=C5BGI2_EDWI9|nr:hypothetical protein [Edwardsiella ictaluri]ACR70388.1 hypothetical protein NT01EI_3247 [Edwardsiella ictaluri 93-146]UCQ47270.1 hypothetical protein DB741_14935 [Edwardsiella ictaluri]UCQ50533.1 hypothetical protein DB731_14915 [Edwardsiella ictaluri]UYB61185.1 hypothetical protein N8I66_14630 [Edwardsiella ictaluri]UYB64412.1 hypothetical protein N8I67_14625 [Edwardsiella ictaluri]
MRSIACAGTLNSQRLGELSQRVATLQRCHRAKLQLLAVLDNRHPGLKRLLLAMTFDAVWYDPPHLRRRLLQLASRSDGY